MIEIQDVHKSFGALEVLRGVSMTVNKGEVVSVIGGSGSGKSTLLMCINGLESIQAGRILVDGTDVHGRGTNLNQLRQRIGIVFQQWNAFPHLTVRENVMLAPRKVLGKSVDEADQIACTKLRHVGLGRCARCPLDQAAREVRSEQLDEIELVFAQQAAAPEADPGRVRREQVRRVDVHQVGVVLLFDGHAGDDADAEAEAHVGLDHVGIARRQHDVRHQAFLREHAVQRRRAGEAEDVRHDGVRRQLLQREPFLEASQWMIARHDHVPVPAIAGQQRIAVEE